MMKMSDFGRAGHQARAGHWRDRALRAGLMLTTALTASAFLATSAHASNWTGGTGDWFDPANWDNGVPTVGGYATLDNGGTAQIEAPGAVSQGVTAGFNSGASGAVEVSGNGASWTNTYSIYLGYQGTGTLSISDGGQVTTQAAFLGYLPSGLGELNVDGEGSLFDVSSYLTIGNEGEGHVSITNGGAVNSAYASLGGEVGSTGSATVDGDGSNWHSNSILVGNYGEGRLDIANGGSVTSDSDVYLGVYTGSAGTVTVDGEDSTLDVFDSLAVGIFGEGILEITNGGSVSNGSADVGIQGGGSGRVTVDGEGSSWINAGSLVIGSHGDGSLEITNGGLVVVENLGSAVIASNPGGTGSVTVDGENSTLEAGTMLTVGLFGDGTLNITNGGTVRADRFRAGVQVDGSGTTLVDGAGSSLIIASSEEVSQFGIFGDAVLTVSNGGSVSSAGTMLVGQTDFSSATINIGAAADEEATAAGTFDVGYIIFGGGDNKIIFNHTDTDFTLASALSGAATLRQIGSGTTTLSGYSGSFWGTTAVEAGTLIVNGVLGGTMDVGAARLGGTGSVGNVTLGNGAVIAPGASAGAIGTLSVLDDLTFNAGSTYEVDVNPASAANDLVHVAGTAHLNNASVHHVGLDGTYPWYIARTILTADTGIDGTFGSVTSNYAFLLPSLSYDAHNVYLSLLRNDIDFTEVTHNPNQSGVAGVLNGFSLGNPIYDQIVTMTEEEARAAFDALSGEAYGSASNAAAGAVQQIRDVLQARIQSFAGGSQFSSVGYAPAAGDVLPGDPPAVWGQVFGNRGVNDASAGAAKLERRSWGFLAGSDKPVGEVSRIGVAVGYSRSDFDVSARSSSGDSNNFHLAGYGSTQLGVVDFAGTLSYTYGDAEAERTVIVGGLTNDLSASYGTHTVQASVEAATDIDMTSVVLTPFAGLAGAYVRTESFTETGGPAALTVDASGNTTGITSLGLRLRHQAGKVTLTGSSAWRHAFGDVDPSSRMAFASTPASSFTVRGTPVSEDTLALGAQVRLGLDEGVDLSFGYAGEFAADARDQGLNAVVRVEF